MATERDDLVARVKAEVMREMASQSGGHFKVQDLAGHVGQLVKGADRAWKITYDTSSSVLEGGRFRGDDVAWKITYDTSSAAFVPGMKEQQ